MAAIDKIAGQNLVWLAIAERVRARATKTGFLNVNCPMCVARGHTMDKKRRCGIKHDDEGIGVFCFQCGFRSRYAIGQRIGEQMQHFLRGIGVPADQVFRMTHWARTLNNMIEASPEAQARLKAAARPSFEPRRLPAGSRPITAWAEEGCDDPHFIAACTYLFGRGDELAFATDFHWSPDPTDNLNQRIIVPCRVDGALVGWTGRATGDIKPKYYNDIPSDLLFNADALQKSGRKFAILTEGVFDALAVDGVSTLGAKMSPRQAAWLNESPLTKIVVPDRDRAGVRLIDEALEHGWSVSCPGVPSPGAEHRRWWDADIKDAAAACTRYGRMWTLRSIIASATSHRMHINMLRRAFV